MLRFLNDVRLLAERRTRIFLRSQSFFPLISVFFPLTSLNNNTMEEGDGGREERKEGAGGKGRER